MSTSGLKDIAAKYAKILDDKKQQTSYKIEYVSAYVKEWLYVVANRKNATTVNFIDCMCNAGIYKDGELGTPIKALEHLREAAFAHPSIRFNIFFNDYNNERRNVIEEVVTEVLQTPPQNITIHYSNADVNDYLGQTSKFQEQCGTYNAVTLLFVDPYNFGTVKLKPLQDFLKAFYAELIFNVFTSDFVRNGKSDINGQKIKECMTGCDISQIKTVEQLVGLIDDRLTTGNIKYTFRYRFKTTTNAELYQIMYCTPHFKGIEQLKKALWEVFKGAGFHKNAKQDDSEQMSVFDLLPEYDEEKMILSDRANEARQMLISYFSIAKMQVSYEEINKFIQCRTMLMKSHIKDHVLIPLINEGRLVKVTHQGKRENNYTEADYILKGGTE